MTPEAREVVNAIKRMTRDAREIAKRETRKLERARKSAIKAMMRAGVAEKRIAFAFGVSRQTIRKWATRRSL